MTGLPDECIDKYYRVFDMRAGCENEVFGHYVGTYYNRVGFAACYCAVVEAGDSFYAGIVADLDVPYCSAVDHRGIDSDASAV